MSAPQPCESCGVYTTGVDCESCGALGKSDCPGCSRTFGKADRFCAGCGHNLKYVNFSNRTILRFPRNLSLEEFQYPADQSALKMLSRAGPVKVLTRFLEDNWSEPMLHGSLEGTAVKVTERQFPRIRRIADTCQTVLNMKPTDVFIQHSATLSAGAIGSQKASAIILTSGLVENLNERELLFVLGRELGHIKADHMFYLNMVQLFTENRILKNIPLLGEGLKAFVVMFLLPWQRKSQVTADRAGLLCCQNRVTAVKSLIKMALGAKSLYDKVDIEEFLDQAQDAATRRFNVKKMGEYLSGSPYVTNRVREVEAFNFSQEYHDIMVSALHPFRPGQGCPACGETAYADNLEEGLMRLSCAACGAAVPVQQLPCPHCGAGVPTGDVGMRDQLCPSCEQPYLCHYLQSLMPELGKLYEVLDISRQSTTEEIEEAFVRKARHHASSHERLVYYRAYRILSDRKRRKDYDEKVPYVLSFSDQERREAPECKACDCPAPGEFCGWCGRSTTEPDPEPVTTSEEKPLRELSIDEVLETPDETPTAQAVETPERFEGPVN